MFVNSEHQKWGRILGIGLGFVSLCHLSVWDLVCLWRWKKSLKGPVLSPKIVTCAALFRQWIVSSSVSYVENLSLKCLEVVFDGGCCFNCRTWGWGGGEGA